MSWRRSYDLGIERKECCISVVGGGKERREKCGNIVTKGRRKNRFKNKKYANHGLYSQKSECFIRYSLLTFWD